MRSKRSYLSLALAFALFLAFPPTGQAEEDGPKPSCTQRYLLCINEALEGDDNYDGIRELSDEMGSIECAAVWVGCVLRRFRQG